MTLTPVTSYPPGPMASRNILLQFAQNPLTFFEEIYHTFGNYAYARIATRDMYLVSDPELLRTVFIDLNAVLEKTEHTKDSLQMTGQGLINVSGDLHRRHRRLIQPLFTPAWIESYSATFVESALNTVEQWRASPDTNIATDMNQLALTVISKTVFGLNDAVSQKEISQAIQVYQRYSAELLKRSRVTGVTPDEMSNVNRVLDETIEGIINRNDSSGNDLISLMRRAVDPETGETLTPTEIRDEAVTFLLAGHETTGNALTWIWYLLAKHPDVEAHLLDELDQVVGDKLPTAADTMKLNYLTRVIKEALRLYPPVWLLGRRVVTPVTLGGYELSPEASITIVPYLFHRNPNVFPDPEVFNPDRFVTEPPKYTYLPFGVGPRVCIGQHLAMNEMILAIATMLPRCKVTLPADYEAIPEPMLSLTPRGGLPATAAMRTPR